MLITERRQPTPELLDEGGFPVTLSDLRQLLRIAFSHAYEIAAPAIILGLVMTLYVSVREPFYVAQGQLLIVNSKLAFSPDSSIYPENQVDPGFVQTQMEVLRSDKIALAVLQRLASATLSEAGADPKMQSSIDTRESLDRFHDALTVERTEGSDVVIVSFASKSPVLAADTANAVIDAFIDEQNAARVDALQSASPSIRDRVRNVGPQSRVIGKAFPPTYKSNTRGLNLIGGGILAGLSIGVAFVFSRELFGRRIRTPEQLTAVSGSECFGTVPKLYVKALGLVRLPIRSQAASKPLDAPPPSLSDSLRRVIDTLNIYPNQAARTVGVTAIQSGDGASTIAINLARLIAAAGDRVLLIDLNLHNPALSNLLAGSNRDGLLNIFDEHPVDPISLAIDGSPSNLSFLPIGRRGIAAPSSSFIKIEAMQRFLAHANKAFDYIIFDLPPLSPYYDVRVCAEFCDHILLVVDSEKANRDHLAIALALSGAARAKLLGTILNKTHSKSVYRLRSAFAQYWSRFRT